MAKQATSVVEAAEWDGTRFDPDLAAIWDAYAQAAVQGWLSRGVLGDNAALASECAVFADLMLKERAKRFQP